MFATGLVGVLVGAKEERSRYEGEVKGSGAEIPVPALQPLFFSQSEVHRLLLLVFVR
jgi:hypothetical protein